MQEEVVRGLIAGERVSLLLAEGDPKGAAHALRMSERIKGALDHGDPEIRALIRHLGEDGYSAAYREGADLPRQQAIDRLDAMADRPVSP